MVYIVIPNLNGEQLIRDCLESLHKQTFRDYKVVVVDNGSTDESVAIIEKYFPDVHLIKLTKNIGFAGGVNTGIKYALAQNAEYIALLNNDALTDKDWLKHLIVALKGRATGIAAPKQLLSKHSYTIDSTGEEYSVWGLPYPRGRGEEDRGQYDTLVEIFAASGAGSLYKPAVFADTGLFDEDFFAYYEDVDLSFRARLRGWQIVYEPKSIIYHQPGSTSAKISGFTQYHRLKNLVFLYIKCVPLGLLGRYSPRFFLSMVFQYIGAIKRGFWFEVFKAGLTTLLLMPKILYKRFMIQRKRSTPIASIEKLIKPSLPPSEKFMQKFFGTKS